MIFSTVNNTLYLGIAAIVAGTLGLTTGEAQNSFETGDGVLLASRNAHNSDSVTGRAIRQRIAGNAPDSADLASGSRRFAEAPGTALARLGASARPPSEQDHIEQGLLDAVSELETGNLDSALQGLDQLTDQAPNFQLAQFMKAELLLAKAQTSVSEVSGGLGELLGDKQQAMNKLIDEARVRVAAQGARPIGSVPAALLALGSKTRYAILVDKGLNRVYLFERGADGAPPSLLMERYTSTGRATGDKRIRGDLKTPEGVYFVQSIRSDEQLEEKYGVGAYTLNYPNALDRKLGKTGHGIWLHGVERVRYSRPPLASEGCVAMPNADVQALHPYIHPGRTPVVIARHLRWIAPHEWKALREQAIASVRAWRQDWQSLNLDRYLSHYRHDFWSSKDDYSSWVAHKTRVARGKKYQRIALDDLNIIQYPKGAGDARPTLVVRFDQSYRSNNYQSNNQKQLYMSKTGGEWKIRFEEAF